jgi:hypothetical protein
MPSSTGRASLFLTLLIKARIQIKMASALGLFLLALQTLVFLAAFGALGLAAIAAGALALNRPKCRRRDSAAAMAAAAVGGAAKGNAALQRSAG